MNTEYYEELGLNKNCTQSDIKKAYHKLARKYHPDKVTDPSLMEQYTKKFQKIGEAYEVLSDSDKRANYDQFGKDSVQSGGFNPSDFFKSFFNNGFNPGFGNQPMEKKSAPVIHQININLEDLYNGRIVKLKITRKTITDLSNEPITDNLETTWETCRGCNGQGVKMEVRQIAPGFVSQTQQPCSSCSSTGHTLKSGYKLSDVQSIIEIEIKKGMNPSEEVILKEVGNCFPGTLPGDIIIGFNLKPHSIYKKVGNNLEMEKEISLAESLLGFSFKLTKLNSEITVIKSECITSPNQVKTVKGLGLPDKYEIYGDLKIKFKIIYPTELSIHQQKTLSKLFNYRIRSEEGIDTKVIQ